jgi:phenylalanyl-tRNA synthetase beta chain
MKVSLNWLKKYLDINLSVDEISSMLTGCGLEVEAIEDFETIKGGLRGLVIGEVMEKIKHPGADRLSITKVNVGKIESLQIVCGAANVAAGQKVLVALPGAKLFPTFGDSFEIKKSKIRGENSEGMICSEDEVGLGSSHEGIMVLNPEAKVGSPAAKYFNIESDSVFEIGLTPNRADAASHIGVARDLCAVVNIKIGFDKNFKHEKISIRFPDVSSFRIDKKENKISVTVEDNNACPRYSGVTISGIQMKESPSWLKNCLLAIGLKPINNIVDATNFVLHETGQPLHAFDTAT